MRLEWSSENWPLQALQNQVIQIHCDHTALKMMFSSTPLSLDSAWCHQVAGEAQGAWWYWTSSMADWKLLDFILWFSGNWSCLFSISLRIFLIPSNGLMNFSKLLPFRASLHFAAEGKQSGLNTVILKLIIEVTLIPQNSRNYYAKWNFPSVTIICFPLDFRSDLN